MKKIASNILIVSTQLIIGGLFLFMLFSDSNEDNKVVVVENDNLNKMADSVSELFVADQLENKVSNDTTEVDLVSEEERKAQEQAEAEAKAKAEEEARIKAEQEAAAKAKAEAEAKAKAEEEARRNAIIASANGYNSKPAAGFNVTTGNRTYSLSDGELNTVAGVVACEGTNRDDMLAVASVIMNRADRRGMTPYQVVAQAGQFSCFGSSPSSSSLAVVRDALNGIRNNNYNSFNGWYSGVSDNYIASPGNRYY